MTFTKYFYLKLQFQLYIHLSVNCNILLQNFVSDPLFCNRLIFKMYSFAEHRSLHVDRKENAVETRILELNWSHLIMDTFYVKSFFEEKIPCSLFFSNK